MLIQLKTFQSKKDYMIKTTRGTFSNKLRLDHTYDCQVKVDDENVVDQSIFIITAFQESKISVTNPIINHNLDIAPFHIVAMFLSEGEARSTVLDNTGDIHECTYDFISINEYKNNELISRSWYKFSLSDGLYCVFDGVSPHEDNGLISNDLNFSPELISIELYSPGFIRNPLIKLTDLNGNEIDVKTSTFHN